ncbi:MAG: protein phosphatase 2C domain-containing protein [Mycobacteriales bacterium]
MNAGPAAAMACPGCASPVAGGDRFCEECGRDLRADPPVPAPACVACGAAGIDADGYCETCGQHQPRGRDHLESDLGAAAGVTDKGRVRHRNEDALALAAAGGGLVAVVCDGVASTERSDEASAAATGAAAAVLAEALRAGGDLEDATRAAVAAAHAAVLALPGPFTPNSGPACTYVSAVVTGGGITTGWLGDSRAYWLGDDGDSARLTTDDAVGHALTRWIGAEAGDVDPHVATVVPAGPGTVLACTDGLWNYLPDPAALAALAAPAGGPLAAARALTRAALEAGGADNVTVAMLRYPPEPSEREAP